MRRRLGIVGFVIGVGLTACLIEEIRHPVNVEAGTRFEAVMSLTADELVEASSGEDPPTVCVVLPGPDWEVLSAAYEGDPTGGGLATGQGIYSQEKSDEHLPETWSCWEGPDLDYTRHARGIVVFDISVPASASGRYTLGWVTNYMNQSATTEILVDAPSRPYDHWERVWSDTAAAPVRDVLWDGSRFIALTRNALLVSTDGRDWTPRPHLITPGLAFHYADGLYVLAGDGYIQSSTDLQRWDGKGFPETDSAGIAFDGANWWAVSDTEVYHSETGRTWTPRSTYTEEPRFVRGVVATGGDLLIHSPSSSALDGSFIYYSDDGAQTWTMGEGPVMGAGLAVHQGTVYAAEYVSGDERLSYRVSGDDWAVAEDFGPTILDDFPFSFVSVDASGDSLFVGRKMGVVSHSTDAVSWDTYRVGTGASLVRFAASDDGVVVGVDSWGSLFRAEHVDPPELPVAPLADAHVTVPYEASLGQQGGTAPLDFEVTSGSLPPGLSLTDDGRVVGDVTAPGDYAFEVSVTDAWLRTDTRTYEIEVFDAPEIGALTFEVGHETVPYRAWLQASGGTGTLTWSVEGTLPPGLGLSGSFVEGTPTDAGTFPFTLRVTDEAGAYDEQAIELEVRAAPTIGISGLDPAHETVPYRASLEASGGTGALTWTVEGDLPTGLSLTGNEFSGTPTDSGAFPLVLRVTDAAGARDTLVTTLEVVGAPEITSPPLPAAHETVPYEVPLEASGGTGALSWTVEGALPGGLSLDAGEVSGTPTASGDFPVVLVVTDAAGATDRRDETLTVHAAPRLVDATLPSAHVDIAYEHALAIAGGFGEVTWEAVDLPSWLALEDGTLTGTPTETGDHAFDVTLTDAAGASTTASLELTVAEGPAVETTVLPEGVVGNAYDASLTATGGAPPYDWTVGGLPSGLVADGGVLTGTPTEGGTFTVTVEVEDAVGSTAQAAIDLVVHDAPVVTTTVLPEGTVGAPYAAAIEVTGGQAPLRWTVTGLPAGLVASQGAVSGTPTEAGSFQVDIHLEDANGATSEAQVALAVTDADGESAGCGCSSGGGAGAGLGVWLLAGLVGLRRRR